MFLLIKDLFRKSIIHTGTGLLALPTSRFSSITHPNPYTLKTENRKLKTKMGLLGSRKRASRSLVVVTPKPLTGSLLAAACRFF
jgi:hypothetical protein